MADPGYQSHRTCRQDAIRFAPGGKNRVGNGLADAAAKLALLFHEMDKNDIEHAVAAWHASSSVAKYLARTSAVVYKANNDVKCPYRRRSQRAPILDSLHILKDPKHVALPIKDGVVCLWCNMRAQDTSHLEKHPCVAAKQHELWKSGDVIMCANCGGYSQNRAKWLNGVCQKPNISAKFRIRRFFQKMQHPANGKPLPETPSFWHNTTREDEPTSRPSQQCHTGVSLESWDEARWDAIRNIGQANPKWSKCDFSVPKPDDPAFLEAIRGNFAISISDDKPTLVATPAPVAAEPSASDAIQRPAEALAPLIRVGARRRSRFNIGTTRTPSKSMLAPSLQPPACNPNDAVSDRNVSFALGEREIAHMQKCDISKCEVCDLALDVFIWATEALIASDGRCAGDSLDEDLRILARTMVLLGIDSGTTMCKDLLSGEGEGGEGVPPPQKPAI